jgi:hypothetical protein
LIIWLLLVEVAVVQGETLTTVISRLPVAVVQAGYYQGLQH